MGGKSTPKAPTPPDYEQLIRTQAEVNRIDQVSPFGSVRYEQKTPNSMGGYNPNKSGQPLTATGGAGDVTQVTELSPELQAVFNNTVGQALTGPGATPFEARALPTQVANVAMNAPRASAVSPYDPTALDPTTIEDALFQRQTRLLEPQFQLRERQLRQNLADRGLVEGSEGYNNALNMELDQQNRARSDAALAAVLEGRRAFETDRTFDYNTYANQRDFGFQQDVFNNTAFEADRQLANLLNQQDFQNRYTLDEGDRNFFLNRANLGNAQDQIQFGQLAALLGLTPSQGITPVDVTGPASLQQQGELAAYQGALNARNQNKGTLGGILGAGGQLGAAALLASDIALKTNIRKIGTTDKGLGWYRWDWVEPRPQKAEGVIAQEVQAMIPDAVHSIDGVLHVDYSKVGHYAG